jgi:alpha-L-fucosidase
MHVNRRQFLASSGLGAVTAAAAGGSLLAGKASAKEDEAKRGQQRLSMEQLKKWEAMQYGMFIHFGMSTYLGQELPDGKAPASLYNPDKLDVDQWVSVARDAGVKYAVVCAKHVAGHCLWPSEHTDYTVANSGNKTDVIEAFVKSCEKRGVKPGLYYCSWDNHNLFGSQTRTYSKRGFMETFPKTQEENLPPYTTSVYQNFMTAQVTELLTKYGPIAEMWIDIPGELGWGYRTFIYNYMAELQPEIVIMMNSGTPDSTNYNVDYAWPSDLMAIERGLPPESGYQKWRTIKGKEYYLPAEVCDTIGREWFFVPNDPPRPDDELLNKLDACRKRGVNYLLDVPPDKHGLIPEEYIQALIRLRKNATI